MHIGQAAPLGRGETVLVIEDDPDLRTLTKTMLQGLGYGVVEAADTKVADQVLDGDQRVDLILSDVVLPGGLNGLDFADQTLQTFPDLKVVFMSGYPSKSSGRFGDTGSDNTLDKPFLRQQLAEVLRRALDE